MLIITPELFGNTWIRPELAREEARLNNQADASATSSSPSPAQTSGGEDYWGEDGFGFDDFLDLINPLQHLPVVSSIYRAITGDEAAPGARILGGALFGGPVGLLSAVLDNAVEEESGKPMVAHVAALFSGDEQPVTFKARPYRKPRSPTWPDRRRMSQRHMTPQHRRQPWQWRKRPHRGRCPPCHRRPSPP